MTDLNATIAALLRDLAFVQTDKPKVWGYKRAAAAVFALDKPIDALRGGSAGFPKIPGLGPSSMRVVNEVLETGGSPTVERAVAASGKADDIARRRALRTGVLSRAEALRILAEAPDVPRLVYRGDLQMHSLWSDGAGSVIDMAQACVSRGHEYCAITDHSGGLPIARGMSPASVRRQQRAIDQANDRLPGFRVLKGIEANIAADGSLDVPIGELQAFQIVLAAPHSKLRSPDDQTARLLAAIRTPGVHLLAHPRGRMIGSRAGIAANWDDVFEEAAELGVAVEIDGDPARQDLDHTLAERARDAGCLFALDSDAHSTGELVYAETALAHARLARIPPSRIINTWRVERLLAWAERRRA